MKAKRLSVAIAALLVASGLWFVRSARRAPASDKSSEDLDLKTPNAQRTLAERLNSPGRLAPPDQTRRFRDFTPEQRVEFARKGHGPCG